MEEWHRVALREAFAYHLALDQSDRRRHGLADVYSDLTVTIARGLHHLDMGTADTNEVITWADRLADGPDIEEGM